MKGNARRLLPGAAVVLACGLAASCGSGGHGAIAASYDLSEAAQPAQAAEGKITLTVGSKNFFTEQTVLGQITLQALEAAGARTEDKLSLGSTQQVRTALLNGTIDMYWGYTGTGAIIHLGLANLPDDWTKVYQEVKKADLERNGVVWLPPAPANDTYVLAMREEVSQKDSNAYDPDLAAVKKLSDLGPLIAEHPDKATICVGPEFARRADGLPGLERHYGFTFPEDNVFLFPASTVYPAVDTGQRCNFGSVFKTDGRIEHLGLHLLKDDKGFFPPYNPSLTMRAETLKRFPDLKPLFGDIASRLDTKTLRQLNEQVEVEHRTAEKVVSEWLADEGLVD